MSGITYSVSPQGLGTLTLNRPASLNALDWESMQSLAQIIERAAEDPTLRVLLLTGAGGNFCAGGDLFDLHKTLSEQDGSRLVESMWHALRLLQSMPVISIAAIEGVAFGAGMELALACDMRVAADDASLSLAQIRLALTPAWGSCTRLVQLVGYGHAMEVLTTGDPMDLELAKGIGLVNRLVPPGLALQEAQTLAAQILRWDPQAIQDIKRILQKAMTGSVDDADALERESFIRLWTAPAHRQASQDFVASKSKPRANK